MLELLIAKKYLIPRRKQLSLSIISLLSVMVIALVVWLIVVFFSVTDGLEKQWIHKLTSLTAPVRITPTDAYYRSYYYLIDRFSEQSGYDHKSIGEKLIAEASDPYNPASDEELPPFFPTPVYEQDGTLRDPVKGLFRVLDSAHEAKGFLVEEFHLVPSHFELQMVRFPDAAPHESTLATLASPVYVGRFSEKFQSAPTMVPLRGKDYQHLLSVLQRDDVVQPDHEQRVVEVLEALDVQQLRVPEGGWKLPRALFPQEGRVRVVVAWHNNQPRDATLILSPMFSRSLQQQLEEQEIEWKQGTVDFAQRECNIAGMSLALDTLSLLLPEGTVLAVHSPVRRVASDLRAQVSWVLNGKEMRGDASLRGLEIDRVVEKAHQNALWVVQEDLGWRLPAPSLLGHPVLLPKGFREAGVLLGDQGSLTYFSLTPGTMRPAALPIYVAGFYDPGIIPVGGKFLFAHASLVAALRPPEWDGSSERSRNGVHLHFDDVALAHDVKETIQRSLKAQRLHPYWQVESYREFDFARPILDEIQGQKSIFLLIAFVVMVVACSNIISMLLLLVNDKRREIGILRAMGASSVQIALIFGSVGGIIGLLGSALGVAAAMLTLTHIDALLALLSYWHGNEVMNRALYGDALPHEMSWEALLFVCAATALLSLLAAIVPAIKACCFRPAEILRNSEG